MTRKDAFDFENFEDFASHCCSNCNANDWYCTGYCVWLEKARNYPIKHLNKALERCGGEVHILAKRVMTWK